jgi:type I restriction enzyme S subunit
MNKRNENRPGYKKTKVGWIPGEWECVQIINVANIVTGSTPSTNNSEYYGGEFPFVGPGDLDNGKYIVNAEKKLTKKGIDVCRKIPSGSILFTCIGSTIGKIAISGKELATNQQINAVIPNKNETKEFIYYALLKLSPKIKILASEQAVPIVNKTEFSAYQIPFPSLPEQKKIAEILSVWDWAIEQTENLIKAKQKLKKGLMQQLLCGKARFKEFFKSNKTIKTKFGELPEDWRYIKISEIAKEVKKKNTKANQIKVLSCTKYNGLVDSLEYFGKRVFSDDTSNYKVVKRGQFAYATNHIEEGSIGYLDFIDECLVSPMYTVFEVSPNVSSPFLFKLFKTELYRHIFEINTSASVDRRGSLRWKQFSHIHVPLPSLDEQMKINQCIESCNQEIEMLRTKKAALREQKKGLMQKLLTGQIRVKV